MIEVIIFDGDHTLYFPNTEEAYDRKFSFLEEETSIPKDKIRNNWKNIVDEVKDDPDPDKRTREYSTTETLEDLGIKDPNGMTKKALELFWESIEKNLEVRDDVKEVLEDLRKRYKLVIASDEFENRLEGKLNSFLQDWKKYFEFMVTPEKTGSMKPSERYYEMVIERLDFHPSEMIMIGDSWRRDLEPAKKLGIKTVLIGKQKEGNPDYHIEEMKELKDVLGDLNERT